jgi:hypothetical protein
MSNISQSFALKEIFDMKKIQKFWKNFWGFDDSLPPLGCTQWIPLASLRRKYLTWINPKVLKKLLRFWWQFTPFGMHAVNPFSFALKGNWK